MINGRMYHYQCVTASRYSFVHLLIIILSIKVTIIANRIRDDTLCVPVCKDAIFDYLGFTRN